MVTSQQADWRRLQHAYGPAEDIPAQLDALRSVDADLRAAAFRQCYANIFHQGTRYSASVAAIPILLGLVQDEAAPDRGEIIDFLLHLAVGYPLCGILVFAMPAPVNGRPNGCATWDSEKRRSRWLDTCEKRKPDKL